MVEQRASTPHVVGSTPITLAIFFLNFMNMKKTFNNEIVIFHLDIDSFFVGCELILRPELKNQDLAISTGLDNSIVSALSYSAKNKGAKVPMKVKEVKQYCPNLICLKPNFDLYSSLSNQIYQFLLKRYTTKIEIGSIDEWFLDVSKIWQKFSSIKNLAIDIQKNIKEKFQLEISIGISYNKFLAKMATDLNKPFGISIINSKNIETKIWPLNINKYWGIGLQTANQLKTIDILTIGDLAKQDPKTSELKDIFKNRTDFFIKQANGISSQILDYNHNNLNIIANSLTFANGPTNNYIQIINKLKEVALMVEQRLNERCLKGDKLILNLKLSKNKSISTSLMLGFLTNEFEIIYQNSLVLLERFWNEQPIIGIGIGLTNLINYYEQGTINIFDLENNEKIEENKIQSVINLINKKMEKKVAFSLKEYQDNKTLKAHQSKYIK